MKSLVRSLVLISFLCSSSCAMQKYPEDETTMQVGESNKLCPNLSGMYLEYGDSTSGCHSWIEKCQSLSYNLLSGHVGYKEVYDDNESPTFPHGSHVEIRQENDEQIEIILWDLNKNEKKIIKREILKLKDGDYTCNDEGVQLKQRLIYFLWVISNVLGTETRVFSINENSELLMHSKETIGGHHTFFPFFYTDDIWVRFFPKR